MCIAEEWVEHSTAFLNLDEEPAILTLHTHYFFIGLEGHFELVAGM